MLKTVFPERIAMLRKENKISQKNAAAHLGISQALLSHYEKGIRTCSFEMAVKIADYYNVSCDYLLGRTTERDGQIIFVNKPLEENYIFDKTLIQNSLEIIYDMVQTTQNKTLLENISNFFNLSIYRILRILCQANPKNQSDLFTVNKRIANARSYGAMSEIEAETLSIIKGDDDGEVEAITDASHLVFQAQQLHEQYPLAASSLISLVKNAEGFLKKK